MRGADDRIGELVQLGRGPRAALGRLLPVIATFAAVIMSSVALASSGESVESGRKSFQSGPRYPWYDSSTDSLRRVDVRSQRTSNPGNRDGNWQGSGSNINPPNFQFFGDAFWTLMQILAWTVLALLLAGIIALLIWAFVRAEGRLPSDQMGDVAVRSASDVDRVESLPFQVKRPNADLLQEATRQYEQGNYGEAIIYLFSYQLVQLDKHQLIHLTKGKTNRQYLREVRRRSGISPLIETTMIAFEDVFFGHHDLERQRFEECWNGMDEFHQQMDQIQAAT